MYLICAHGKAHQAFSKDHEKVPLLDIFGLQNIHHAAYGIETTTLTPPWGQLLDDLCTPSADPCFAHLSYPGKFELTEVVLKGFQNFVYGTFCTWYIPWRSLSVIPAYPTDLTSTAGMTASWKKFLAAQSEIFETFDLSTASYSRYGIGDIATSLGYAYSYNATEWLDFIDTSIEFGLVFPTSHRAQQRHFFELPIGYEGSLGYFGIFDISTGWYDWITTGAHLQCLGLSSTQCMQRIKTHQHQEGLFILQDALITLHKGPAYSGGVYLKADHVLLGFSFTLAYSFVKKTADQWYQTALRRAYLFPDQRLGSWTMHTIHIQLDYDCATHYNPNAPRVGFIYNTAFRGSRSLDTAVTGGLWEMTIIWQW